jgi:hypothetical protein
VLIEKLFYGGTWERVGNLVWKQLDPPTTDPFRRSWRGKLIRVCAALDCNVRGASSVWLCPRLQMWTQEKNSWPVKRRNWCILDRFWLPLSENRDHHLQENKPLSQEMHLKIPLLNRGLKMSNPKPCCRVSVLHRFVE